jgi:hypothetical protein
MRMVQMIMYLWEQSGLTEGDVVHITIAHQRALSDPLFVREIPAPFNLL